MNRLYGDDMWLIDNRSFLDNDDIMRGLKYSETVLEYFVINVNTDVLS